MINYKSQSGFSLVETLVAITILLVVIVGPMTISSTTAKSTSFASEQVIAFFLAQEGAELAQKARDDLMLLRFLEPSDPDYVADPWQIFANLSGSYRECYESAKCGLEIQTNTAGSLNTPRDCGGTNCRLYFNDSTGAVRSRYTHTGNYEATDFTRKIFFEVINSHEVKVTSEVIWRTGSLRDEQSVSVVTHLFNVYEN